VLAQERFSKTLSSGLLLQKFPFDRQKILIAVESLKYPEKNVQFSANQDQISFSKESYTTLSEWRIEQVTAQNTHSYFPPEKQNYSRVAFTLNIRRNSGYYVLKVMLPLLLITIASWSVFWISPQEFSTQISIAFTNLLTVVALLLVVNDTLPRVGYLTFLDGFTLLCFLGIMSAVLELIVVHRWTIDGKHQQLADKIHQVARWLVPGLFLLGNVGLVALTFFPGAPSR
jgi:Neurotransmitter-gated ion-channel ligand binding domain/Neurotransmitter-gated ion-channel transmembrane region